MSLSLTGYGGSLAYSQEADSAALAEIAATDIIAANQEDSAVVKDTVDASDTSSSLSAPAAVAPKPLVASDEEAIVPDDTTAAAETVVIAENSLADSETAAAIESTTTPELITSLPLDPVLETSTPLLGDQVTELNPEEAEFHTVPDFAADPIRQLKGVTADLALVQITRGDQDELWLFDVADDRQENIELGTSLAPDFPIAWKEGFAFWLDANHRTVSAFRPEDRVFLQEAVPAFDTERGERAVVSFPDISWDVIVGADDFYFFNEQSGEIFSDDNSAVLDNFRRQFGLDSLLSDEALGDLNLYIETADE